MIKSIINFLKKKKKKRPSAYAVAYDYYVYYISCSGNHIPNPDKLAIIDLIDEGQYSHNEIYEAKRDLYKFQGDMVYVQYSKRDNQPFPSVVGAL